MLETIAIAFRNEVFFKIYMWIWMATMLGPLVALTIWHNIKIRKSAGGRELMQRNARLGPRNLRGGIAMAHDIAAGRYGETARRLQNRTYLLMLVWAVGNLAIMLLPITLAAYFPDPNRPAFDVGRP